MQVGRRNVGRLCTAGAGRSRGGLEGCSFLVWWALGVLGCKGLRCPFEKGNCIYEENVEISIEKSRESRDFKRKVKVEISKEK